MRASVAVFAALLLVAAPAVAQQAAAPAPAGPSKNPAAADAGAYNLDGRHASVIARLGHMGGFSNSTFRFGAAKGTLTWDPAKIENSKVDITVDPKSIMTPVAGFADELAGDKYLNAAAFPEAKFVSTSIRRTGPTKGEIMGNLTFRGQTKPITIEAELVGAGKNMRGISTVGFSGTTKFKRSDFGFGGLTAAMSDEVELLIDVEFNKAS